MRQQRKIRLGFIVEGDNDREIVEPLIKKLLGEECTLSFVRMGGVGAFYWAFSPVVELLTDKHCDYVVVLADADSNKKSAVKNRKEMIERPLREHHLNESAVSVCLAVPVAEAWILARYEENPEQFLDAKERLSKLLRDNRRNFTAAELRREAESLNLAVARQRSPSLDSFLKIVEKASSSLR